MEPQIRVRRIAVLLAWVLAAALIVFTWGPQSMRPHLFANPQVERFGAYFLTAAVFVFAYPKRFALIAAAAAIFAVLLELGQFVAPGRDPGLSDAIAKAVGGVCGAIGPNSVASRTPDQGTTGWGGRHRRGPTGGAANGIPENAHTPSRSRPCTLPPATSTMPSTEAP